jgi:hypothetical protein
MQSNFAFLRAGEKVDGVLALVVCRSGIGVDPVAFHKYVTHLFNWRAAAAFPSSAERRSGPPEDQRLDGFSCVRWPRPPRRGSQSVEPHTRSTMSGSVWRLPTV